LLARALEKDKKEIKSGKGEREGKEDIRSVQMCTSSQVSG
jgi:hypothetical protein